MRYLDQFYGDVPALLKNVNHKALNALGLIVWQPRPFRHPEPDCCIVPQQLRINARCLVLLYSDKNGPVTISDAEHKILQGMLSVLEVPSADIMQATIYGSTPDLLAINAITSTWQPQYILQLSMDLPECAIGGTQLIRTYSPGYLLQNKQYKSQAYKALLTLRAILHGAS